MNQQSGLQFYKYQGTGNDFVMVDNRSNSFPKTDVEFIAFLCDRRFGVGGDGLILLEDDDLSDFKMVYFNADGKQSTMCGNGGRCIVAFARELGIIEDTATFSAIDGLHEAQIKKDEVVLKMLDVATIRDLGKYLFLDTGSPHHVQQIEDLEGLDVKREGERIRYGIYGKAGCNINFVHQITPDTFAVRTYERGVEDETLSCGTGVTAVALAMYHKKLAKTTEINVQAKGGELKVTFEQLENGKYTNIYLSGPAQLVYKGNVPW